MPKTCCAINCRSLISDSPLETIPDTPATGFKKNVSKTEREILNEEINNLRQEKETLMKENNDLKDQIDAIKLGWKTIENNDSKCRFYTGLPWDVCLTIFTFLSQFMKVTSQDKLHLRDQFFLTLLKLRLDLPVEFLAFHTGISSTTVSDIFWEWIELMSNKMDFFIKWPDRETLKATLPGVFKQKFPRLTSIIDCFEIFIERPRNLNARSKCYSNYKKHSTVKVFISCTPNGSVSFLSCAWGGRASDVEIVRESGFIDPKYHMPGDQILADRGFTLTDDFASMCSAELIIPSFTKGKSQLSAKEVETSRKISSVRIHIERVIGLIKQRFKILQGTLSINVIKSLTDEAFEEKLARVDKLIRVCGALVNLSGSIVYNEKEEETE